MFKTLSLFALLAPLASALTLQVPTNPTSSGAITVRWTVDNGDPELFSLELINVVFNNAFAIATNVDSSLQELNLTLPVVPVGDGYTLQAVNIGNINDVFSTTAPFAIGAATTTLSSTVPATTISLNRTSTGSNTATTGSQTRATTTPLTNTNTNTNANTNTANTATAPPTGAPTSFNTGAASALNIPAAGVAAALLSAVAGALAIL